MKIMCSDRAIIELLQALVMMDVDTIRPPMKYPLQTQYSNHYSDRRRYKTWLCLHGR
jgi:hypothetical protein